MISFALWEFYLLLRRRDASMVYRILPLVVDWNSVNSPGLRAATGITPPEQLK